MYYIIQIYHRALSSCNWNVFIYDNIHILLNKNTNPACGDIFLNTCKICNQINDLDQKMHGCNHAFCDKKAETNIFINMLKYSCKMRRQCVSVRDMPCR